MTDACITIDSSDEDDVQIMDPPVDQAKPISVEEVKRRVPLQTVETGKSIFTTLLSTCKNADPSSETSETDIIINKMWKRFHAADSSYTSSTKFVEFVKTLIVKASKEPFCQLKSVSDDLKFHKIKEPGASTSANADETDRKTDRTIRKLEKLVSKLQRRIDRLEEQEVDFNDSSDEQNSAYIQVCRYKTRICDVFKKICELRKTDTFDDSLLRNIKFSGTNIPAVNRAIERFYNSEREFPDFRQVLTIVEKANDMKNLGLLPPQCHETAVQAFRELGKILKRHRQRDLTEYNLNYYLKNSDCDPAFENPSLEKQLQENRKLYGNRIDEVIDKYARRQIEEKLEPEEVPDDATSETAAEDGDEEEEEDVEVESNADDSCVDEDDEVGNNSDENGDQEKPFEARDFNIVVPDLREMPEWAVYQKAERARQSALDCADTVCQPVPGCSKDSVDNFCLPCANKTPALSATKRSHALNDGEDDGIESRAKMAKVNCPVISVDLTKDSQSTKPATKVTELLPMSSNLDDKDPLDSVKASCSQLPNGIADKSTDSLASGCESLKPQPFVVVDVESILAKKPSKYRKFTRNKAQYGGKIDEKPLSSKTESMVTHKDAAAEGVSFNAPTLKDHLEVLSKNGIRIVEVQSKVDLSSKSRVNDKSKGSTSHARDGSDEAKNKLNGSNVKKNCEIIDTEEVSCKNEIVVSNVAAQLINSSVPKNSTRLFSKAVTSNANQNSKPTLFRLSNFQAIGKTQDNRSLWPKFSPSCNRFPTTSTPQPVSTHQPRSSSMPMSNRFNVCPRSYPGSQRLRHPFSQPQFGGSFGPNQNMRSSPMPPRPRNVYMGSGGATETHAVQSTHQIVQGNSICTKTVTWVREVMQPGSVGVRRSQFASNGSVGRGGISNPRFGRGSSSGSATQSTSSSSNHSDGVPQDPRQKMKRKNSADVITLE